MKNQPRVDPVVTELITAVKASSDDAIAGSLILGLAHVVKNSKENVGVKARESCIELAVDAFGEDREGKLLIHFC